MSRYAAMTIFCALILFSTISASAQTLQSPLEHAGGVESHLYKSDTIMLENTVLEDGTPFQPARKFFIHFIS